MTKNANPKSWNLPVQWNGKRYSEAGDVPSNYTPFKTFTFDSGSPGDSLVSSDGFYSAEAVTGLSQSRSNDIAGPFGGGKVGKIAWTQANIGSFGGKICTVGVRPAEGSQCWIRIYHYFPNDFCFQNNGGGDAWGNTKWVRIQWESDVGPRHTFQIGNWSTSTCNNYGTMWGATTEGIGPTANLNFASPLQISKGGWHSLEWYVLFSTNASIGKIRCWLDGQYGGEVSGLTMPASGDIDSIVFGNYINGRSVINTFYIDEGILTFETPDDRDSNNLPMIGPNRKVEDF